IFLVAPKFRSHWLERGRLTRFPAGIGLVRAAVFAVVLSSRIDRYRSRILDFFGRAQISIPVARAWSTYWVSRWNCPRTCCRVHGRALVTDRSVPVMDFGFFWSRPNFDPIG
ncbi:MAG: hypothetical protein GY820_05795, partial [Gammaproteobacteria bacterium]|nr:hypothetical protein [Gammaproteobacteria bacterium]